MNRTNFMYDGKNILALTHTLTQSGLAEVALKIAETHPEVFARAVVGNTVAVEYFMEGVGYIILDHNQLNALRAFGKDDKVRAVKYLREQFNIGLKEAKDLTEWLAKSGYCGFDNWYSSWVSPSLDDLLKQQIEENATGVKRTKGGPVW